MNSTDRRGFLGLLAHLPLVGVLFAKPKEWDQVYGNVPLPPVRIKLFSPIAIPAGQDMLASWNFDESRYEVDIAGMGHVLDCTIRWINVKDRLPEESHVVLICDQESGRVGFGNYARLFRGGSFIWGNPMFLECDQEFVEEPTHWAEIPAAPEKSIGT